MIRKNQPVKFSKPVSSMKTVYECVNDGARTRAEIIKASGLVTAKARAAIWNLVFVGIILKTEDSEGRTIYVMPGTIQGVASCLKSVRSIFDVQ